MTLPYWGNQYNQMTGTQTFAQPNYQFWNVGEGQPVAPGSRYMSWYQPGISNPYQAYRVWGKQAVASNYSNGPLAHARGATVPDNFYMLGPNNTQGQSLSQYYAQDPQAAAAADPALGAWMQYWGSGAPTGAPTGNTNLAQPQPQPTQTMPQQQQIGWY